LESEKKNLLVLLGPTCVGKSATAIHVARVYDGEIINCDSMQVYRGFNIGTDKLPPEERENIPHHLLDICEPHVQFTAADFVQQALHAIPIIRGKKHLPIVVGGTGLYLKALIDGLFPEGRSNPEIREELEREAEDKGLSHLGQKLKSIDPVYAEKIGPNDRIRIIRALEVYLTTKKPLSEHFSRTRSLIQDFHILKIGLDLERPLLYKRIEDRVDRMFERGLVDEVNGLLARGVEEDSPPFRALGYKHVLRHLKNQISLDEAKDLTKTDTRHYAKRQMTWFRKMEGIHWFDPRQHDVLHKFLEKELER
jgi:tRNA dimethylallyltransferase